MSYKTRDGKTHQSTVIMGDNGLPIDGIATIAGSYIFLESQTDPLVYTALAATVTLPVGNDLSPVVSVKARYTGRYVLITKDNSIYYINRQSIDVANRTFVISRSDSSQITPASIDLSPGWTVAEADIVNRLATTSAAKIDSVEFRDLHFQMQLDGDPVTLTDDEGDKLDINPDGTIGVKPQGYVVRTPTIVNLNMPLHNTEYRIDLPTNIKRFKIKAQGLAKISLSYNPLSNQLLTIYPGCVYEEEGFDISTTLTLHIKSNKPNTVIEAVYWE